MSISDLMLKALRFFSDNRSGQSAVVIQPYTEVNSKTGRQYEAAFYSASLATSTALYLIIEVGDEPVAVKDVNIQFNSERLSQQIFEGPTYVGPGTELTVYNFRDQAAVADDVVIRSGITPSDDGTAVGPKIYSLGTEGQGNRTVASINQRIGVERILEANTTYALKIINEDGTNASEIAGVATWYQGGLDLPLDDA